MQSLESLIQTAPQPDLARKEKISIYLTVVNNISYLGSTEMLLVMYAMRITKPALSKVHLDDVQICGGCGTVNVWVLIFSVKIRWY